MQASSPEIQQAWLSDVLQILEIQRNFLNGIWAQCVCSRSTHLSIWVAWHLFMSLVALQSPIEYQRRESKSNSLGRNMKYSCASPIVLRPQSSVSVDQCRQPCLLTYNTSLPAFQQRQHSLASNMVSMRRRTHYTTLHCCSPCRKSHTEYLKWGPSTQKHTCRRNMSPCKSNIVAWMKKTMLWARISWISSGCLKVVFVFGSKWGDPVNVVSLNNWLLSF